MTMAARITKKTTKMGRKPFAANMRRVQGGRVSQESAAVLRSLGDGLIGRGIDGVVALIVSGTIRLPSKLSVKLSPDLYPQISRGSSASRSRSLRES